jgi:Tfp pilus assembly protein FimT
VGGKTVKARCSQNLGNPSQRAVALPVRPSFTLLEVVLVLALLVVLGGMLYPALEASYGSYRVTAATDMVRAAWAQARSHAMDEGRPYRFSVIPEKNNFRIAPDSSQFWGGSDNAAGANSADQAFILEDTLPKGVRFSYGQPGDNNSASPLSADTNTASPSADSGSWASVATFLPDGTARADVEIVFQSKGARPVILTLRALTGVVSARQQEVRQ